MVRNILPTVLAFAAAIACAGNADATNSGTLAVEYRIEDRGMVRTFTVATDVVAVGTNGERSLVPVEAEDVSDLQRIADAKSAKRGGNETVELVLDIRGRERTDHSARFATAQILVQGVPGADLREICRQAGLRIVEEPDYLQDAIVCEATGSAEALILMEHLRGIIGVTSADVLLARQAARKQVLNDPLYPQQWHLRNDTGLGGALWVDANIEPVWERADGSGVTIAIVDDGVDHTHPDLQSKYDASIDYDFNDGDDDGAPVLEDDDHGTACAGIAAAEANNGIGVAGAAYGATLTSLRLISQPTSDAQEASAFSHRTDVIDVSSNSWGPADTGFLLEGPGTLASAALANGCASGRDGLGTIYVFAGGNGRESWDNSNADGYSNSIYTIAVGSINDAGFQSYYSEPGANLVISAPSNGGTQNEGIRTTDRVGALGYTENDYTPDFGGTSAATPIVAGVCALMLEVNPSLGWRDVQEILIKSARRVHAADPDWKTNGAGLLFNHKYGAGMVDAEAAVELAEGWSNLGPKVSVSKRQRRINEPIPDGTSSGLYRAFRISTANAFRIEHVEVEIDLDHPYRGELEIELTSPSGMKSFLLPKRPFDSSSDIEFWTMTSVRHWGEDPNGTWFLSITDRDYGNSGILRNATLTLHGTEASDIRIVGERPELLSESNLPANNVADPGEKVSFYLPLKNLGVSNAGNVTAELVSTDSIRALSGVQDYGLIAAGSSESRPFSFQPVRAGCGSMANVLLRVEADGVFAGFVPFAVPLGEEAPYTFNGGAIQIEDADVALPSPSTINVSGVTGRVQRVEAVLKGLSHSFLTDVGALLDAPAELQVVLFDSGPGISVSNRNYRFTDNTKRLFPFIGQVPSGSYQPTQSFLASFTDDPGHEPGASMGEFNGLDPNGTWRLFVEDFSADDTGSISGGWTLQFWAAECTDNVFFDVDSSSVSESESSVTIDIIRSGGWEGTASVDYATENGSAESGADFVSTAGTLTFNPGEWKKSVVIDLIQDTESEADETFIVSLSEVTGESQAGSLTVHTVTIIDDETGPEDWPVPYVEWIETHELEGPDAAPSANPAGDGTSNMIKFASNLDPNTAGTSVLVSDTGTSGLPILSFANPGEAGAVLRIEFLRRTDVPELSYIPSKATSLDSWEAVTSPETVEPIDAIWERVIIEEPLTGEFTEKCFGRVEFLLSE